MTKNYIKSLISVQIGNNQVKSRPKRNSISPAGVVKITLDENIKKTDCAQFTCSQDDTSVRRHRTLGSDGSPGKYHDTGSDCSIVCDLSHVTWIDEAGCNVITWLGKEETLSGIVLPLHLEV